MIRLTRCTQADKAGTYFRLHLATGDNQAQPASPSAILRARWTGPALSDVTLVQGREPERKHLVRLCRGLHPTQKVRLAPSINRKRAYYDVTITAPKTVSLAALLYPNHLTARYVMNAHMNAVEEVTNAVATMLQPQSKTAPKVSVWLGATFHHTHTREGDPHLHSHLILPNVMRNTAGEWRAMQVNIAGINRTHLGLIYGHALTRQLQRIGFTREELVLKQRDGNPEIGSLLPLVPRYSQARRAVLAAAESEEIRPLRKALPVEEREVHSRSQMPVPTKRQAMQRRSYIADQIRRPKPKDADDPVRLNEEADRWKKALSDQEVRSLIRLLDDLDITNPRQRVQIKAKLPPAVALVVQAAFKDVCRQWQRDPTESLLLRSAVAYSAGRHSYEELQKECRTRLEKHRVAYAAMWARIQADFVSLEEAKFKAFTRGPVASRPPPMSGEPAARPPTHPAPTSTGRDLHR